MANWLDDERSMKALEKAMTEFKHEINLSLMDINCRGWRSIIITSKRLSKITNNIH